MYNALQVLLTLAKGIIAEQKNIDKIVEKILVTAMDVLQCERYIVHVVQEERKRLDVDMVRSPTPSRSRKQISVIEFMKVYLLDARTDSTKITQVLATETYENSLSTAIARYVLAKNGPVNLTSAKIKTEFKRSCDDDGIEIQV